MPYTDKIFEISFKDVHFASTWKISIFDRDAYAGATIDPVLTGRPLLINYGGKGDLFDCIHGSEATINILAGPSDDYDWIKTTDPKKYQVKIYLNTVLYWIGFVLPGQALEDYLPFRVLLVTCSDGLGLLADTPYANAGVNYEGYDTYVNILTRALALTGLSLKLRSVVNIFDVAMDTDVADDPLFQASINQNKFINSELEPSSCKTVTEECLRVLKCRVFQSQGVWYVVRTVEYEGTGPLYRQYDTAGAYDLNDAITPQRTITDISGSPRFMLMRGTRVEQNQGIKSYEITEDYGWRESALMGYSLPNLEFQPIIFFSAPKHFTISATSGFRPIKANGEWSFWCPSAESVDGQYMKSDPITVAIGSSIQFKIMGGSKKPFDTAGDIVGQKWKFYFRLNANGTPWYWTGKIWTLTPTYWQPKMESANLDQPSEHSFLIDPWPAAGLFELFVYDTIYNPFVTEIIVVPYSVDNTAKLPQLSTVNIEIDANNVVKPQSETFLFTDGNADINDDAYNYDGIIQVAGAPSTEWKSKGWLYFKLWEWAAQYQIDQNTTPSLKLRANILGQYHYYQILKVPGLGDKLFPPDDVEIDCRASMISGTWIELKPLAALVAYTESNNYTGIASSIGASEKSGMVTKITLGGQMIVEQTAPVTSILKSGGGGSNVVPASPDLIRSNTETVNPGETRILFTDPLPEGYAYTFATNPIPGLTSDGQTLWSYPHWTDPADPVEVSQGFLINFEVEAGITVTFSYTVNVKR